MQPVRERAQLRARLGDLLARDPQQPPRLRRVAAVELAAGDVEELAERDQPLLGAVVEVAPDPLALLVGRLEHLGARGDQRALALAQPAFLLAPLELSADPRGEDLQRRELVRPRVQRLPGGHREVADRPPVAARAGDGEVAVEAVLDQERVLGEGGRDARLVADDRALVQQLAGRAVELVLTARGQRLGRPRGQRARGCPLSLSSEIQHTPPPNVSPTACTSRCRNSSPTTPAVPAATVRRRSWRAVSTVSDI